MNSQQPGKLTTKHRRIPRAAKIMAGTGALVVAAGAILIAGSSTGTLALWNDSASIPDATITVGAADAGLSISAGTQAGPEDQTTITLPASTWVNMLPGDVIGTPITVTNLDAKSYELGAAINLPQSAVSDLRFALAPGNCTAGPLTGTVLTAAPTMLSGQILGGHASQIFCLQVELSPSVAANKQGTQITPSFTMSVYGY